MFPSEDFLQKFLPRVFKLRGMSDVALIVLNSEWRPLETLPNKVTLILDISMQILLNV